MRSRDRFSTVADDYHKYRPSYPRELIDWLEERSMISQGSRILDVGCGSGIFMQLLADRGARLTGIDPNREMIAWAAASDEGSCLQGVAEELPFPADTFHLALSAQAFHWFRLEEAISEMRRVVVPAGSGAAIWNCRKGTPLIDEYNSLISRYSTEYDGGSHWDRTADKVHRAVTRWQAERKELPYRQRLGRAAFVGRTRSSSYVEHGITRKEEFFSELNSLFEKYEESGEVVFEYRTIAVWWRFP